MKIVKLKEVAAEETPEEDSLDAIWGLTKRKQYATMEGNARGVANSFGVGLMITDIRQAVKNENRVNIFVNGRYAFSLDVAQVVDLGVKVGKKLTEDELEDLKKASEFGKLYQRTLEWVLMRPRSEKEIRDYLVRKVFERKIEKSYIDAVLVRLKERKYIDDAKFAEYYVENRFVKKGVSRRRLLMELSKKGVAKEVIEEVLAGSERNDAEEIRKIIAKKRAKYDDDKLIAYLCRQGFSYDLAREQVSEYGKD